MKSLTLVGWQDKDAAVLIHQIGSEPILREVLRSTQTPCILISGSLVVRGGKPAQCLDRWDEVIGPADSRRISGQGVTDAILCSRHTIEHAGQAMLVATEADKHCPMRSRRPERGIAAEDVLFYPIH